MPLILIDLFLFIDLLYNMEAPYTSIRSFPENAAVGAIHESPVLRATVLLSF